MPLFHSTDLLNSKPTRAINGKALLWALLSKIIFLGTVPRLDILFRFQLPWLICKGRSNPIECSTRQALRMPPILNTMISPVYADLKIESLQLHQQQILNLNCLHRGPENQN